MLSPSVDRSAVDLIVRIAEGDETAFSQFYDRYAGLAFGVIRRVLREKDAAEDVLQEVFWQVWREAPSYDPGRGSPEAWLVMRAKTRAIDKVRSIRRKEQTFVAPLAEGTARSDPEQREDPSLQAEDRELVEGALARLPEAQRRVIELSFFEGLTQVEIAARLREPLGTVKTRARLALERLRTIFSGKGSPAG